MYVSQSNREITLLTPFSSTNYVALATIQMADTGRQAYAQINIVSSSTFYVRCRFGDTIYSDQCYCFFIGY